MNTIHLYSKIVKSILGFVDAPNCFGIKIPQSIKDLKYFIFVQKRFYVTILFVIRLLIRYGGILDILDSPNSP